MEISLVENNHPKQYVVLNKRTTKQSAAIQILSFDKSYITHIHPSLIPDIIAELGNGTEETKRRDDKIFSKSGTESKCGFCNQSNVSVKYIPVSLNIMPDKEEPYPSVTNSSVKKGLCEKCQDELLQMCEHIKTNRKGLLAAYQI